MCLHTSNKIGLWRMPPFLMFATVIQAIIIKAPTIKPSLHDSSMYPSGVAPSRQCPLKLAFRRTRLLGCSKFRSVGCNGAISQSFVYRNEAMVFILQAFDSADNPKGWPMRKAQVGGVSVGSQV